MYWEYVIEGSYALPSGRDLVTNAAASAGTIFGIHKLVNVAFGSRDPRVGRGAAVGEDGLALRPARTGPRLSLDPPVGAGRFGPELRLALRVR